MIFYLLDCIENTKWMDELLTTCADYEKWKYCENGGIGSSVPENYLKTNWPVGPVDSGDLVDARRACCVCGGNRISGKA